MTLFTCILPLLLLAIAPQPRSTAIRIKELTSIEGVRDNQLIGYGVIVGLAGTGDKFQTVFSSQTLSNLLQRMGISVPGILLRVANTAAVMVTATLPPFAQSGTRIDVTAASAGDASNLQGGLLLLTPLKGPDGQIYAVAQGAVVTGGVGAGKGGGSSQVVNHPTVGRVVNGALVEKTAPSIAPGSELRLQLRTADFTTAARIAEADDRIHRRRGGDHGGGGPHHESGGQRADRHYRDGERSSHRPDRDPARKP